jgi:outer membrane protein assembly factor BamB
LGGENWETVYSFTSSDRFVPAFSSMGFGQNNNGDKILVWKNRSYTTGNKDRTDIFAYNLDADSLLWRNTDFEIFGGILPLQVENNRVYGIVKRTVFCLDLSTGDSIWTNDFKGIVDNPILSTFDQGAMYLSSQHIIIKGRSSYLVMLEKSNGKLFKVDNDLPDGINDRFTYFEGKLFLASSKLTIVDVQSGEILNDPNIMSDLFRMIESKIAIDPDRRVMYFHNGRVLFCVKIPDNL